MLIETTDLIVQRLKDECPSAKQNIFDTADLAGVKDKDQLTPALHVVLYDYDPTDVMDGEGVWDEIYLVIVVVKNVANRDRVAAQRAEAKNLLREALVALGGWKPSSSSLPLKNTKGPRPYFSATHAYFPLAFIGRPMTGRD